MKLSINYDIATLHVTRSCSRR